MGTPKPLSSPRPLSQNRASEQRAALLLRGPGAAAPGALSTAFSRESGNPPRVVAPRSGILRISCLYDRHYLTLLVTAALSDQRGRSSAVPPTRWQAFGGRLLRSPPTAAPLAGGSGGVRDWRGSVQANSPNKAQVEESVIRTCCQVPISSAPAARWTNRPPAVRAVRRPSSPWPSTRQR